MSRLHEGEKILQIQSQQGRVENNIGDDLK